MTSQPGAGAVPPAGQPAAGQPVAGQPATGQQIEGQPVAGQHATGQPVPRTRVGSAWTALIAAALVLLLLLVFILENLERVRISYFGAHGHLPLGVALLLAAVGGALLTGVLGISRLFQLRRVARRRREVTGRH